MMTFSDLKENIIKSFIADELLDDGIYPTLEVICAHMLSKYGELNANTSMINQSFYVEDGESGSSSKMSDIINRANIDINTLYKFSDYLYNELKKKSSSSIKKVNALFDTIYSLEKKAKEQIALNNDGNFNSLVSNVYFNDKTKVNQEKTTAFTDTNSKIVEVSKESYSQYSYAAIDGTSLNIAPLTLQYTKTSVSGAYLSSLFRQSEDSAHIYSMYMPSSYLGSAEIALRATLINYTKISGISIGFYDDKEYFVALEGMTDSGHKIISPYASFTGKAKIEFSQLNLKNISIKIKTPEFNYDNQQNKKYDFAISNLSFFNSSYSAESILVTSDLSFDRNFNSIVVNDDSEIGTGCSIDYYVAHKKSAGEYSDYIKYEGSPVYAKGKYDYSILDNAIKKASYASADPSNGYVLNGVLPTDILFDQFPNTPATSPVLLRNLQGFKYNENQLYQCKFFVTTEIEVDFYTISGFLNSEKVEEKKILSPGLYDFKFYSSGDLDTYKDYLNTLYGASFYYGSHTSEYVGADYFICSVSRVNQLFFTIAPNNLNDIVLVNKITGNYILHNIPQNEEMLYLYKNLDYSDLPSIVKVKAVMKSNKNISPRIKQIIVKVS